MTAPDIAAELELAASTIRDIELSDRKRLLQVGMDEVEQLCGLLSDAGVKNAKLSPFMADMPLLVETAEDPAGLEVLIAAGMSLLAAEVQRLRDLVDALDDGVAATDGTLFEALDDVGFEPHGGRRRIVGEGRQREKLKRRDPNPDT